jgi:hypothetical protein
MVSERNLSQRSRFWWSGWTPDLNEQWLRSLSGCSSNSTCRITNWAPVLTSTLPPRDSDLVAETAFGLFNYSMDAGVKVQFLDLEINNIVVAQATQRIEILRGSGRNLTGLMTPDHVDFAKILAQRLLDWVSIYPDTLEVQPRLPGTGIVDACHPDLIAGNEIIEVKMAKTLFKLSDIRQALVYSALAWLGTERRIDRITLTNPLLGVSWNFNLYKLIREISGKTPLKFYEEFDQLSLRSRC